jgi:hypothetical protein
VEEPWPRPARRARHRHRCAEVPGRAAARLAASAAGPASPPRIAVELVPCRGMWGRLAALFGTASLPPSPPEHCQTGRRASACGAVGCSRSRARAARPCRSAPRARLATRSSASQAGRPCGPPAPAQQFGLLLLLPLLLLLSASERAAGARGCQAGRRGGRSGRRAVAGRGGCRLSLPPPQARPWPRHRPAAIVAQQRAALKLPRLASSAPPTCCRRRRRPRRGARPNCRASGLSTLYRAASRSSGLWLARTVDRSEAHIVCTALDCKK